MRHCLLLLLSLLPVATTASGSSACLTHGAFTNSTIADLKAGGFKGNIVLPNDPTFPNVTDPWALNYKETPKLALEPTSASDVSIAIKWTNKHSLDFAIRSGGRAVSQSCQVIIALDKLNKVNYDASNGVVHLGPGSLWGDVYNAMASLSVTVLGGRVPLVGVGGFTVGGGISYLQNLHGLASDSIVDAQVVLANGNIVMASSDKDLLYAVRGAGFTIGVVTEFIVKAYPKPSTIFSGFVLFTMDQFEAIQNNVSHTTATNTDPNVALLLGVVFNQGVQTVLVFPIVFGDEKYAKSSSLAWIWQLPGAIQDTTAIVSWETLQSLQLAFVHHPAPTSNYQQHSIVVKSLTADVISAAVNTWQTPLLSNPRWQGLQILFEPFIPGAFSSHFTSGPWPHSSNTMHVIQLFIEQVNAQPGDNIENAHQLITGAGIVEDAAGESNVLQRYPDYFLQGTPAYQFYGSNLPKLQSIKEKFDPQNRFNKGIQIATRS